jgi:hypothetical protein
MSTAHRVGTQVGQRVSKRPRQPDVQIVMSDELDHFAVQRHECVVQKAADAAHVD